VTQIMVLTAAEQQQKYIKIYLCQNNSKLTDY